MQQKNTDTIPYFIDLTQNLNTSEVMLSEFVEDIDYILLENNKDNFIKWALDLRITKEYLVIRDYHKIFIYNWKGELISSIDKRGRGPGEYSNITAFEIDNKSESILVFSGSSMNYYKISDGTFTKKIELPGYVYECRSLDSEHYYFGIPPIWGRLQPAHVIVSNEFDTIHQVSNKFIYNSDVKVGIHQEVGSYTSKGEYYYKEYMDDTLYNISAEGGIIPYAIYNTGKYRFSAEKRTSQFEANFTESMLTSGFFTAGNYLFMGLSFQGKGNLTTYNIKTGKTTLTTVGISNDIDNGLPLKFPNLGNDTIMISMAPVSDIIKFETPEEKEDTNNKFRKIKEIVNENDNPIVIIYRLKK